MRARALTLAAVCCGLALGATPALAQQAVTAAPAISAPAAILIQPSTGDIVFQRRATQHRAIASTTKLMTALLTLERRKLSDKITASPYAAAPAESVAGIRGGERLTTADLLRALLLASANDAAATLAVDIGGSRRGFVRMMNERARRAGLLDTHYANPIGLDEGGNYSSAADLAKLALLVRANPFARQVMDRSGAVLRSGSRTRYVRNRNTLIAAVPWMSGVKTGHTGRAGYVLVGSAERGGVNLVSVVMGTGSEGARNSDTLLLMEYGFRRYRRVVPLLSTTRRPLVPGKAAATVKVKHGDEGDVVRVVPARTVRVVTRRDERALATPIGLPRELEGPLPRRSRVGTLVVRLRGRVVDRVPLVTARSLERASWWDRNRWIASPPVILLLICLAGVTVASLQRARGRREERSRRAARSEIA